MKPEGVRVRVLSRGRSSGAGGVSQALCCCGEEQLGSPRRGDVSAGTLESPRGERCWGLPARVCEEWQGEWVLLRAPVRSWSCRCWWRGGWGPASRIPVRREPRGKRQRPAGVPVKGKAWGGRRPLVSRVSVRNKGWEPAPGVPGISVGAGWGNLQGEETGTSFWDPCVQ